MSPDSGVVVVVVASRQYLYIPASRDTAGEGSAPDKASESAAQLPYEARRLKREGREGPCHGKRDWGRAPEVGSIVARSVADCQLIAGDAARAQSFPNLAGAGVAVTGSGRRWLASAAKPHARPLNLTRQGSGTRPCSPQNRRTLKPLDPWNRNMNWRAARAVAPDDGELSSPGQ
ncbi:hypothetical protein BDY21DRAFT_115323 [Lineolata rhizophorae]|uniref:Uncharacterized protein n=1 Tax=Lineolata rhizophorae TaxID=578093 RepID=A0A6A6NQ94_9PEZI|nr:hypothetical protein BDY21DRAFT_115323 [Lineolata rhizophorae]